MLIKEIIHILKNCLFPRIFEFLSNYTLQSVRSGTIMRSGKLNEENSICSTEKEFKPKSQDDSSISERTGNHEPNNLACRFNRSNKGQKLTARIGIAI